MKKLKDKSKARRFPHKTSPEAIEIYATRRGIQTGLDMSEAFELVVSIRGI